MRRSRFLLASLMLITASLAVAQNQHGGHGAAQHAAADNSPSSKAYREANQRMHAAMDIKFTGDADIDFARGMMEHHKGAIDMAKVLLAYGKDDEMRKLAQSIIADQEKEIAQMQAWLKKKGS